MVQFVPAVLATSEEEYQTKLKKILDSAAFEGGWIQIDFMDNQFVQNQSVGIEVVKKYSISLQREAHLMVVNPAAWAQELLELGWERIVWHIEVGEEEVNRTLQVIGEKAEKGLALNPETEVEKLLPFLSKIDTILVMSVHPGFGGQKFLMNSLEKVEKIRKLKPELKIGIDGGVNEEVIKGVVSAGVDYVVMGSYLLEGDVNENLERIWEVFQ